MSEVLKTQLIHVKWDDMYRLDVLNGNCIDIYEKAYLSKKNQERNLHGIMSPLFCTDWSDIDAFTERYRCNCGRLKGRIMEGEICDKCMTKVSYRDVDYKKTGWISLNGYKIIQPNMYVLLQSLIGSTKLQEIITRNVNIDINGMEVEADNIKVPRQYLKQKRKKKTRIRIDDEDNGKKKSSEVNPFLGKGMLWFSEHVKEVIYHFWKKKKSDDAKNALAFYLLCNVDKIFASHIPVYNAALRPERAEGESYSYYKPNTMYNIIVITSRILYTTDKVDYTSKSIARYDVEKSLIQIQNKVNLLYQVINGIISGKTGHIVSNVLAGSYTNTARCVITPDPTLRIDQIDIPYVQFAENYKFEIIGHLCEIKNITEAEAYDIWFNGVCNFDEELYQLMTYINKKYKCKHIVGRNPTINYGSLLIFNVRNIKRNYNDYSLSLPLFILKGYNADFDGDQLNELAAKTKKVKDTFSRVFDPYTNFAISLLDGKFNTDVDLLKDSSIGIYDFCNI